MDTELRSAPAKKKSMHLELFGQRLTVTSDTEEAQVREIVDFVNHKLEGLREASRRAQTEQLALLVALNIAEELFRERNEHRSLKREVRRISEKVLHSIDNMGLPRPEELDSKKLPKESGSLLGPASQERDAPGT